MRYHCNIDESSDQTLVGKPLMTAAELLRAIFDFRNTPGNGARPIQVVDETGFVLVSEDRHMLLTRGQPPRVD